MALSQGNSTFAEVPSTLTALTQLIDAQSPNTKPLTTLFERLQPLVTTATPVLTNFSQAIRRPGANNDLTELVRGAAGARQGADDGLTQQRAGAAGIGADHRLLRPLLPRAAGARCARSVRPAPTTTPTATTRASARSSPTFKLGANNNLTPASSAAGARRSEDRPAAPLPGRGHPARGRRLLAVHRQRPAQLRPDGDTEMNRRRRGSLAGARS